jgi:hypothetical protein
VTVERASARVETRREQDGGFDRVLRRAEAGKGRRPEEAAASAAPLGLPPTPTATSTATPTPIQPPTSTPTASPVPTLEAATSAGPAARAALALRILRHAERAEVEIAAGEELRYGLAQTSLGVEIRARAAPGLERVARAQLHAVAGALSRRGVRLARAEVLRARPGRGNGEPATR